MNTRLTFVSRFACVAVLALAVWAAPAIARAVPIDVTVAELIAIDRGLDGDSVRFTGEAIGEDLHADGSHRWINVLGDGVAVGVFVTNEEAEQIEIYGDHTHQGAMVEVVGTLNIGCDQHGGEFDVHAEQFTVLDPGASIERPLDAWKGIVAVVALIGAAIQFRAFAWLQARRYE